jgi:hypothetical protein
MGTSTTAMAAGPTGLATTGRRRGVQPRGWAKMKRKGGGGGGGPRGRFRHARGFDADGWPLRGQLLGTGVWHPERGC